MRILAALAIGSLLALPGISGARPDSETSHSAKTAAAATESRAIKCAGTQTAAAKRRARSSRRRKARSRKATWRTRQLSPTPERYKEIQRALINKGYLSGPATGGWGPDSVAALRRFQKDQNLEPTGKLDSLTLISLGLGPKRESTAALGGASAPATTSSPNPNIREPR